MSIKSHKMNWPRSGSFARRLFGSVALGAWVAATAAGACSGHPSVDSDSETSEGGASGDGSSGAAGAQPNGGSGIEFDAGSDLGQAGAAGFGADSGCGESKIEATKKPASLLLVIDRSASMDVPPQDPGSTNETGGASNSGGSAGTQSTKWELLKGQLVTSLGTVEGDLSFGLELYPYDDSIPASDLWCEMPGGATVQVDISPGTDALGDIESRLDATAPAGNTPTSAALQQALEYFTTGDGATLEGDKYVLLATDGGPNCNPDISCDASSCIPNLEGISCSGNSNGNCCSSLPEQCLDDQASIDALASLAAEGIRTFVVGIPGSESYSDTLNQFADAGQTAIESSDPAAPRYFRVDASSNMQNLSEVLSDITSALIKTCRLELDSEPPDLSKLNVYVDGNVVPQLGDDGWSLSTDTTPPTIELKGLTCEHIETVGVESVSVKYGCPTVIML